MPITVIPIIDPLLRELVEMLENPAFDDAIFIGPDNGALMWRRAMEYHPRVFLLPTHSVAAVKVAIKELKILLEKYNYQRIFFATDTEGRFYGVWGPDDITPEIYALSKSGLLYMDPTRRGTYGYTAQALTAEELNARMRIIDGPLWTDV